MGASLDLDLSIEAICPECGRRLVYAGIVANGYVIRGWVCDCEQRDRDDAVPGAVSSIVRAREWDDARVVLNCG